MSDWMIIPSDEDIEHGRFHKYIDKIRTASGKWRYIYEKSNNLRRKVKANKSMQERMKTNIHSLQNKESKIHDRQFLESNPFHGNANEKELNRLDSELRSTLKEKQASLESYKNFVNDIMATEKEYLNTPIGKAESMVPGLGKFLDFLDKNIPHIDIPKNNNGRGTPYTPSYSTQKPTTSTRGTSYTPSYKTPPKVTDYVRISAGGYSLPPITITNDDERKRKRK